MMSDNKDFSNEIINNLKTYMSESTCNFTAVDKIIGVLHENGFKKLDEAEKWDLKPNGRYFVVKNDSAIFPFILGSESSVDSGFHIISAHSDSPCFKIKPNCEIYGDGGVISLNVEKYGGGILYTWFDRPLSISGRVMLRGEDALHPVCVIVDLKRPVAVIPHLAIHFNRGVNEGNPLSVQKDMKPVIGYYCAEEISYYKSHGGVIKSMLRKQIADQSKKDEAEIDILDYELSLYPYCDPVVTGESNQFFQSGRIDDLSMAFAGLEALLRVADKPSKATRVLAIFDNEETGSATKQGAHSPILRHIFERIALSFEKKEALYQSLANSFMISADDAHAWHPNYNEKYDPTNHPVVGGGPVVKINANCKYMTDAHSAAVFHALCDKAGVNMQYFVNHSDVAGGSTLGNISSVQLDIPGVDVGVAIWAMHSAVESMAISDHVDMVKVFMEFYSE